MGKLNREMLGVRIGDVCRFGSAARTALSFTPDGGVVFDGPVDARVPSVLSSGTGQTLREYLAANVRIGDQFDVGGGYTYKVAAFEMMDGQVGSRELGGRSVFALEYPVENRKTQTGAGETAAEWRQSAGRANGCAEMWSRLQMGGHRVVAHQQESDRPDKPTMATIRAAASDHASWRQPRISPERRREQAAEYRARTRQALDDALVGLSPGDPVRVGAMAYVESDGYVSSCNSGKIVECLRRYGAYLDKGWRHERAIEDCVPKQAPILFDAEAFAVAVAAYRRARNL